MNPSWSIVYVFGEHLNLGLRGKRAGIRRFELYSRPCYLLSMWSSTSLLFSVSLGLLTCTMGTIIASALEQAKFCWSHQYNSKSLCFSHKTVFLFLSKIRVFNSWASPAGLQCLFHLVTQRFEISSYFLCHLTKGLPKSPRQGEGEMEKAHRLVTALPWKWHSSSLLTVSVSHTAPAPPPEEGWEMQGSTCTVWWLLPVFVTCVSCMFCDAQMKLQIKALHKLLTIYNRIILLYIPFRTCWFLYVCWHLYTLTFF